jgi:intermediate cleaving peptidase 55
MCSYPFQQNNNLLYFTGFNEPGCCLIMTKSSNSDLTLNFFVTPNDENSLLWSGPRAGIEGAKEIFGLQNTFDIKKLKDAIEAIKEDHSTIFIDYHKDNSVFPDELYKLLSKSFKPLEPFTTKLRLVKCTEELELMKKSGSIASESFKAVHELFFETVYFIIFSILDY